VSRRKDRERFRDKKRLNPDYAGFRGQNSGTNSQGETPLQAVKCSICGRIRNVPIGLALESGDSYMCLACREKGAAQEH